VIPAALLLGTGSAVAGSLSTIAVLRYGRQLGLATPAAQPATPPSAPAAIPLSATIASGPDLRALYRQVAPAVVAIQTVTRSSGGEGSGFIVDEQGHVVTNNHVVQGASRITLRLLDGTTVPAQVMTTDASNDLAVLRADIPQSKRDTVRLGDSDTVEPGEPAVAMGSPFGFEHSITSGIVSAVDRQYGGRRPITGLIQTDAAVNPGNSGGPLLNAAGEVIGVTSMGVSPVRGSVGVSFAVPINAAKRLLAQVKPGG
jgi:putative serine protease PepD